MLPTPSRPLTPRRYGYLLPFGLLAAYGLLLLLSWWFGSVALVQPRPYDPPLPANGALCLLLLGLTPIALGLRWDKTGLTLGCIVTALALITVLESSIGVTVGIDHMLGGPPASIVGAHPGRMAPALALVCLSTAMLIIWVASRPRDAKLPLVLGMAGSFVLGYAITALFAYRNGLNRVPAWQNFAQLGPQTSFALILLGVGLMLRAAHQQVDTAPAGPRWLWFPVTLCGLIITFSFWISLRERELSHIQNTTQLTSDYVATIFRTEISSNIQELNRLAKRSTVALRSEWERDVNRYLRDADCYRSVQLLDGSLRTRWFVPSENDRSSFNHGTEPARLAAINAVRERGQPLGVANLLPSDQGLVFAVYVPALAADASDGFIVGEFLYAKVFQEISRTLDIARRYDVVVGIERREADAGRSTIPVRVFQSGNVPDENSRQTLVSRYETPGQQIIVTLHPRPGFAGDTQQYLATFTLLSGLGVSVLLGIATRLGQAALRRRNVAEQTSRQLRQENEERSKIEERLKIADERLNLAFESTQAGVYEWDVETDQVYCTPSVWKMIGVSPDNLPVTGTGWLELLHPDDRPAVRNVIDAHFRGKTAMIEIEHCVHLKNGEEVWLSFRAKCVALTAAHQPRRVVGTVQNIHASKRTDEALRQSQAEARLLALVASKTDNAVVITDAAGNIEWVNDSYTRLTGRLLDEVAGHALLGLLANPENDGEALTRIHCAFSASEALATEALMTATNDRQLHVSFELQPAVDDDNQVQNFIAIATDISTRVETERALRRAKEEADQASRSKSEFLASMSHEIRTPMNGVIGMTSLLLDTTLNPEQRDYVNTIRNSGDSLLAIINEILDFSKIESGKLELDHQPFELAQCVEEVVDQFVPQTAAKRIELAYFVDAAVPACIFSDSNRIRQILVALVNNAVKFTPRGFISIEVRLAPGARPNSGLFHLDFTVSDTGIGIPADRQHLLFQPFTQVDSSSTRKFGGTGLGLAICQRLCQLLGGAIEVDSTPGKGTRVRFSIETTAVPLAEHHSTLFAPLPILGPVLAVDDQPANRAMLEQCLRRWSLAPQIAGSMDQALAVASRTALVAAVIDHDLGNGSGLELVSRLRTHLAHLPVVLLVPPQTMDQPLPQENAFGAMVIRLPKPLKPYPLHEALRRALLSAISGSNEATGGPSRPGDTIPLEILLVEDNAVNRKVALGYLTRLGYQAATANNGREAVALAQQRRFDLILMDLQMPEMDGITATMEIRRLLPQEFQPVILALTANAMPGDRERCLAAGMNDHLSKPLKGEELRSAIQRFFGSQIV